MADPQHLGEDPLRVVHGLQREAHDDVVEGVVLDAGEPLLEIELQHVDAVADRRHHPLGFLLHAVAAHLAHLLQILEQPAVAAAEVEHPFAGLDPGSDDLVVVAIGSVDSLMITPGRWLGRPRAPMPW